MSIVLQRNESTMRFNIFCKEYNNMNVGEVINEVTGTLGRFYFL